MNCIKKVLEKFKKLFGKEAIVEIIDFDKNKIIAKFYGNMCYTCGTYDYFDDFAIIYSEECKEKLQVESFKRINDEYIVIFKKVK
jgi:hypothetical protein